MESVDLFLRTAPLTMAFFGVNSYFVKAVRAFTVRSTRGSPKNLMPLITPCWLFFEMNDSALSTIL